MNKETTVVYIALGSNLANPLQQVQQAVGEIHQHQHCSVINCSPWYLSKAIGPGPQPDYINGVIEIETVLTPLSLLDTLQQLENSHRRTREIRWGARTLDLDLLLYGDISLATSRLTIPHPQLKVRNFVLLPLHDVAPTLILPDGDKLSELVQKCSKNQISLLSTPAS